MKPEYIVIPSIFIAFAIAEVVRTSFFHKPNQQARDGVVEAASTVLLLGLTQPAILLMAAMLMGAAFPAVRDSLIGIPVVAQIGLLLVFDDMTQYWWHRTTHNTPWLYKLHRAHHDAGYMSIRIVYRNGFFYFLLMPSIWLSGVLIYLGLAKVYSFYLMFKMLVIFGAHSDIRWDKPLYEIKRLSPVMWLLERTISTPATHSAHHGKHQADGITNYKGNYGNLLFFWDVLFRSAKITRRYPEEIGVENLEPMGAAEQLFWPVVRKT